MGKNVNKKTKDKIFGPNVKATLIFTEMQTAKTKAVAQLKRDWDIIIDKANSDGKLDRETIEVLKIYLGRTEKDPTKEIADKINARLDKLEEKKDDGKSKIILTLSSNGDLYQEYNKELCYSMNPKSLRAEMLRLLIKADDYVPGPTIQKQFGKSYETITSAKRDINEISREKLHLPEGRNNNLIISKDKIGYRINPIYPINTHKIQL
jgi:hypothetical protein